MSTKTISIRLKATTHSSLTKIAAARGISVNSLISRTIDSVIEHDVAYRKAMRRAIARMEKGWNLGFVPGPREELYRR